MTHKNIYEDGTAEFVLFRAIFPIVVAMGLFIVGWHFGGFDSNPTGYAAFDVPLHKISTRAAWISLVFLPPAGLFLAITKAPTVKLPCSWVAGTLLGGLCVMGMLFWIVSFGFGR